MKYNAFLILLSILIFSCSKNKSVEINSDSANKTVEKKEIDNPFFDKAEEYNKSQNPDSAFLYYSRAKDLYLQHQDSLSASNSLINMAMISNTKGDYFGSQEMLLEAISYFNKYDTAQYSTMNSAYFNMAEACYQLKEYKKAVEFLEQSIKYTSNSGYVLIAQNSIANAYRRLKEYQNAIPIYQNILNQKISNSTHARTLANLAYTRWEQNPDYDAAPELLRSLEIQQTEGDILGQNAGYSFMADYYSKKDPAKSLFYATKMYEVTRKIDNPKDQLEALQRLIKLSSPKDAKRYFDIYYTINDSLQTAQNAAKNQFALIRYEDEKNKADNLRLQKENTEKEYQITRQKAFTYFTLFSVTVLSIFGIYLYKKRKQRLELTAQNTIKESQLKTSKKVHDVVANGLYRVMTEIENQDDIDKEEILDRLDGMYQKSRDISYEVEESKPLDFQNKITGLLQSFNTPNTTVSIKGNTNDLWNQLAPQVKNELEHIFQELMVNMKKHSRATIVTLSFEQKDNQVNIHYMDNGIGITDKIHYNNGLTNTVSRIECINGKITFDNQIEKGFKVLISVPIS